MRQAMASARTMSKAAWAALTRPRQEGQRRTKPAPTGRTEQVFSFVVGEDLHWRRALTRSEARAMLKRDLKLARLPVEAAGERRLRRQKRSQPAHPWPAAVEPPIRGVGRLLLAGQASVLHL